MKRLSVGAMFSEIMKSLLIEKPATVLYPVQRLTPPERFRGRLHYDQEACTLCGLCARDCPGMVIKVVRTKVAKEDGTVERGGHLEFEMDRCVFCGQCAQSCNQGAISFSHDFELAQPDREAFSPQVTPQEQAGAELKADDS